MNHSIRVACHTRTWETVGGEWKDGLTDTLDMVADAGYRGIEISSNMVGSFRNHPEALKRELDKRNLLPAAFAYARRGFADPHQREADLAGARNAIAFVRRFREPRLGLGGAASPAQRGRRRRRQDAVAFCHEVGRRHRLGGRRRRVGIGSPGRIRRHPQEPRNTPVAGLLTGPSARTGAPRLFNSTTGLQE